MATQSVLLSFPDVKHMSIFFIIYYALKTDINSRMACEELWISLKVSAVEEKLIF